MTKPRSYQTEAIIIRKIKLGEADRILTLYTPRLGKIRAVAKGVRRSRSKMSGHLELLTHSLISLARGKNLDTVTNTQTINSFLAVKNDLKLTSAALYVMELVDQFTEDDIEDYPLFQLLRETLLFFDQAGYNELVLRYFEMHVLDQAGYKPQLYRCVSCNTELQPTTNSFCASAGGMLCPDCARQYPLRYPLSVNTQKVLRLLQNEGYQTASKLKIDQELALQLEMVTSNYIRYLLEREIKSAAWLKTMKEATNDVQIRPHIPTTTTKA